MIVTNKTIRRLIHEEMLVWLLEQEENQAHVDEGMKDFVMKTLDKYKTHEKPFVRGLGKDYYQRKQRKKLKQGTGATDNVLGRALETNWFSKWETSGTAWPPELKQAAIQAVIESDVLAGTSITDVLGAGMYGIAFSLANGNVLKLFLGGQIKGGHKTNDGLNNELKMYNKILQRLHTQESSVNEVPVYQAGKIDITSFANDKGIENAPEDIQWGYVEMSEVIPLLSWLVFTGRVEPWELHVYPIIRRFFDPVKRDFYKYKLQFQRIIKKLRTNGYGVPVSFSNENFRQDIEKHLINWRAVLINNSPFTEGEADEIIKAIKKLMETHGLGINYDIHHLNMGISLHDKKTVIIFDF